MKNAKSIDDIYLMIGFEVSKSAISWLSIPIFLAWSPLPESSEIEL